MVETSKFFENLKKKHLSYPEIYFGVAGTISGFHAKDPLVGNFRDSKGVVFRALDFPLTRRSGIGNFSKNKGCLSKGGLLSETP